MPHIFVQMSVDVKSACTCCPYSRKGLNYAVDPPREEEEKFFINSGLASATPVANTSLGREGGPGWPLTEQARREANSLPASGC